MIKFTHYFPDLFGKKLPLTCDWYLRVLQQTSMGKVATQQLMISRDNDVSSQILQDFQRLTTRVIFVPTLFLWGFSPVLVDAFVCFNLGMSSNVFE